MADRSGASTETLGKRVIVKFGFISPKVSIMAQVLIPMVSLVLGASSDIPLAKTGFYLL